MIGRRSFLLGLGAAVCAPAIIRPGILMPVKKMLAIGDGVALKTMAHPVHVPVFDMMLPPTGHTAMPSFRWLPVEYLRLAKPGERPDGVMAWAPGVQEAGFHSGDIVIINEPTAHS